MGICNSCEATAVAVTTPATVKVVSQDGKLEEFSRPVTAAHVLLQKDPTCFVCSSDDMELYDFVSAVSGDEELQPGQLYFLLPLSMLRRPLLAEEMAALAVRASAALMSSASSVGPLVFPPGRHRAGVDAGGSGGGGGVGVAAAAAEGEGERRRPKRAAGGAGGGRNFTSKLRAIAE